MKLQQPRHSSLIILCGAILVSCLAALTLAANAQTQKPAAVQTPAPSPLPSVVQPASQPVRLNVIVTDKSNQVVGDLRREDFRVEEDGVRQTLTQFAREELPVSYTLVVDNSGSLRNVLEYMLRAGSALVSANRPGDETSLVRFVSSDQIAVVQDFTGGQAALMRGLSQMYVEMGRTAVIDAVYLSALHVAERRKGEAGRRRALILLSDGEDRVSFYKQSELQKLLRKLDVQVFAIGIVAMLPEEGGIMRKSPRERAAAFLNSVTQETGGRAFFPKDIKELQEAVGEIARDLRTQYTLGYQSTNPNRDGKFRKVQVKLSETAGGGKRTIHARSGYFAPGATEEEKTEPNRQIPRLKLP